MGLKYFQGWNLVDFAQFAVFVVYYVSNQTHTMEEREGKYNPELKLTLVVLAFVKCLFFIRIFERFGFMVQMIKSCVEDLLPFITYFITFLFLFALCLTTLDSEIDEEVAGAEGMGYFAQQFLQAFRTSIGELGMPRYRAIARDPDAFYRRLNISLIWGVWYIQTFAMLVIMLNFIIAVINSTYERVKMDQLFIGYRHKADLNLECYELISLFDQQRKIGLILFSNEKEEATYKEDLMITMMNKIKKSFEMQSEKLLESQKEIHQNIQVVKGKQHHLDDKIEANFAKLSKKIDKEFRKLFDAQAMASSNELIT